MQGVGFRPFVHRLAVASRLGGTVRNGGVGVLIDVQGEPANLDAFCRSLTAELPTLASIERIGIQPAPPLAASGFEIAASERAVPLAGIPLLPPDVATCERCIGELFDLNNRRFGHPFISCTDCGPRFTIVLDAPYDRERTTMARFAMCAPCRSEYEDPADRRFHAEAIACPDCGPRLRLVRPGDKGGGSDTLEDLTGTQALSQAVEAIRRGAIVAVKALGGYQLACDATSERAVARLRARKRRVAKPFALMVRDLAMCESLCDVDSEHRAMLSSAERPIVLLARRAGALVADSLAPGQRTLGVMLPSTPLHHLLLAAAERPLVMTSGNRTDEPVAIDDATALDTLADITDVFLVHDRAIVARCDDSVMQH
ncbi:MAG: carbamoyltransferase HypF, partial [Gemmatimonadaceae bacterium]|nr:carbamoyltransferase HypF [Gemmatimonadaceae bacterium]